MLGVVLILDMTMSTIACNVHSSSLGFAQLEPHSLFFNRLRKRSLIAPFEDIGGGICDPLALPGVDTSEGAAGLAENSTEPCFFTGVTCLSRWTGSVSACRGGIAAKRHTSSW
jgi:hypothetical protein